MSGTVTEVSPTVAIEDAVKASSSKPTSGKQNVIEPLETVEAPHADSESGSPASADAQYPTGHKLFFIALAISGLMLTAGLDGGIVGTAVPAITDHFHTVADVGWYYSAYRLCSCAFQFMFGKLYKLFPMKRVLCASMLIFLVGTLLCATATSSRMFVVGRAVTGLAVSGGSAGCWNLLVQICPLHKRSAFIAIFGSIETVSTISSPMLGGVLTQNLSWRWCFWITLPIGAFTMIALLVFLPEIRKSSTTEELTWQAILLQLDLIGNLVFIPSMTCLFIALSWAGTRYAWNDPVIIGLLVAFAVLMVVFVLDQIAKQDEATLPPRVIKDRNVIAAFFFCFCLFSSMAVWEYYMPTYFQAVRGYSPSKSGYMMLPAIVGFLLGFLLNSCGTTYMGFYTPFAIFASVLMPVAAGLLTTWSLNSSLAQIIIYSGLAGFAAGTGAMAPQQAVQTTLPAPDAPLGMAVVLFAQGFGPALCVSLAHTILTSRLAANLKDFAPNLDVSSIENMGLTQLRTSLGAQNVDKVLAGFDKSISQTWYLTIGLTCASVFGSLALEWRSTKQKTS